MPARVVRVIARLNVGGPAIHAILLTVRLDRGRYSSHLVTGVENPHEGSMLEFARAQGVHPVIVPDMIADAAFTLRDIRAIIALIRLMRRVRPQIVHTHTAKAGMLGRLAARLTGVPVVVHTFHGHILHGYFGGAKSRALRLMERALAAMTDAVLAVSERVRDELVGYRIAPAAKIAVVPLGLDLESLLRVPRREGRFRAEWRIPPTAAVAGIVGRLFPIKNHRLFLSAAAKVAAADPRAWFVVVGDGSLRPDLEAFATTLGIRDRVVFTGWRHDLAAIYSDLDLVVVSSDNEGTPVSAIEGMAAALPVVATRVGGLPDLVADGTTGLLVPPKDPEALAAAILAVLADQAAAAAMGRAGRERARTRYAIDRLVSDLDALYERLLARKGLILP